MKFAIVYLILVIIFLFVLVFQEINSLPPQLCQVNSSDRCVVIND